MYCGTMLCSLSLCFPLSVLFVRLFFVSKIRPPKPFFFLFSRLKTHPPKKQETSKATFPQSLPRLSIFPFFPPSPLPISWSTKNSECRKTRNKFFSSKKRAQIQALWRRIYDAFFFFVTCKQQIFSCSLSKEACSRFPCLPSCHESLAFHQRSVPVPSCQGMGSS